jgi:hypothetical protein
MATEVRFLPNAPPQTNRLTPHSRQTPTPPDPAIGAIIASFAFLAVRVTNAENPRSAEPATGPPPHDFTR